jgi:poly-beta-1,6-N-acetyl-D-glucosamine synthase
MSAFRAFSLMFDCRLLRSRLNNYPGVTILIAAYNEAAAIADTIHSLAQRRYLGDFEVLVIDGPEA